jgi:hypothetical protein
MSEIRVDSIGNESNTGGPVLSGITTFSGQKYFIPPTGTTAERPSDCPPGSIRFNTDSAHLEYWNGLVWLEFEASSEELGDNNNTNSTGGTGHRGVFMGGLSPGETNLIDYITIPTLGNAQDFGNLTQAKRLGGACASATRGLTLGGFVSPSIKSEIDLITFASTGDATDFGDLTSGKRNNGGLANSVRGLSLGGVAPGNSNTIDAVIMAATGTAQDFGDLVAAMGQPYGTASPVRGVIAGGETPARVNTIQYVTISTQANAQDFGDLTSGRSGVLGFGNATRGLFAGGEIPASPTFINNIDFVTMASTGNSQDFGDLDNANGLRLGGSASSPTRGIYASGVNDTPSASTVYAQIHAVTIQTTGNAIDFGDVTAARWQMFNGTVSNGHGGL